MLPDQKALLIKRHRFEKIFRRTGLVATGVAVSILLLLLGYVFSLGASAFRETHIFVPADSSEDRSASQWSKTILDNTTATTRTERRMILALFTRDVVRNYQYGVDPKGNEGVWILASGLTDAWSKDKYRIDEDEQRRPIKDFQIANLEQWRDDGRLRKTFPTNFFFSSDSRYPELAGIAGALKGTLLTLLITLVLSFPLGVLAAVYLEEFARQGRLSRFIELNINNLAAVPSIIFGLLGLAVLLNGFALPRSAPLVGGIVLSMMVMPIIIIASRSAIRAVSPSIREAAFGMGASHMQAVLHFVLPQSMPGIMTGSLLGMSRALGETAPLLMIGMVSFIGAIPEGFTSPSTVLSVQIFLWADSPERAFVERTSGAILVLLTFLVVMNLLSQLIRSRFEKVQ